MKIQKFAVSILWGEGYHYFVGYTETEEKAKELAKKHLRLALITKELSKRTRTPTVHIWENIL